MLVGWLLEVYVLGIYLRSYQDGYRLGTGFTYGDFIVLPPLGDQATSTMTWYSTQLHFPDTRPTGPYPILIMPSTWLGSDKYQFCMSLV